MDSYSNRMGGCGLHSSAVVYGQVVGCCEHGNESSGSIKCGKFLDYPWNSQLLKIDCTPCSYVISESDGHVGTHQTS